MKTLKWFSVVGERSALEERAYASALEEVNTALGIKGIRDYNIVNIETKCESLYTTVSPITGVRSKTYQAGARVTYWDTDESLEAEKDTLDHILYARSVAVENGEFDDIFAKYGYKIKRLGFFDRHKIKNPNDE
ncbi:MAG: hypothetical protein J6Y02_10125 [Pseudobutyrivibrio sp.]|nr:hypothetical protein [Pseudobutyrivibrio sp.]